MLSYVLLAVLCSIGITRCELQPNIDVVTIQNVTEYLLQNRDAKLLQKMEINDVERSQIRYTIGRRVNGMRNTDLFVLFINE